MHHSKLGPSTSERGHEPPRHVNASAAAMPPAPDTKADARRGSSPERVAPLTDAAIAAAPNRISLEWNRRRRPGGGPSGSRCRPRARESSDKEEERACPQRSCLNRGAVAHHPLARAASAAPSRARARRFGAIEVNAPPLLLIFQHHALASTS